MNNNADSSGKVRFLQDVYSAISSFLFYSKSELLIFILILVTLTVNGATPADKCEVPGSDTISRTVNIFGSTQTLNISLSFDLSGFMKKADKASSFDGTMIVNTGDKDSVSMKVTLKHRGEYRYQTCSFPPIMINFRKPVLAVSDSGKIKKLKLVTHCTTGSASDDYVLREYLVYKLYSVFTDTSFRVRLVKVTYIDSQKKRKPITQYGFFIEPIEMVAARINSTVLKAENLNQRHIMPPGMDRVAIFNYMIANWDWSVPGQHNVAILKSKNVGQSQLGIAIPYDFDLCGVVNADYGTPSEAMGLKSSRDRRFAGMCRERETLVSELKYFLEKREELFSIVNEFPELSPRSKKDITSFLDQFFSQIEKPRDFDYLVNTFLENCKKL